MLHFDIEYFNETCRHCQKVNEISKNIDLTRYKCIFCKKYIFSKTPEEFSNELGKVFNKEGNSKEFKSLLKNAARIYEAEEIAKLIL